MFEMMIVAWLALLRLLLGGWCSYYVCCLLLLVAFVAALLSICCCKAHICRLQITLIVIIYDLPRYTMENTIGCKSLPPKEVVSYKFLLLIHV
jgi:hypothetical protein